MAALLEALPQFGSEDLVVCHRTRAKGTPSLEVWTLRHFAAKELVLSPVTTEVKEGLWTRTSAVFLGVPQAGPGKHPEGKMLALDGRGRANLAAAGVGDSQERFGNLFWAVERSTDKGLSNLVIDQVPWSLQVNLKIPGSKKRKADVAWPEEDLPKLPLMLNPEAIPKHTKLVVFIDAATEKALKGQGGQGAASSGSQTLKK
jgi:hypothetical protein